MSDVTASGTRVLLVEDEPNMARTLAKILERKGYDVAMAANGQEALSELGDGPFQVVVTDLNMPVMDGMQLLRRLQGEPAPPPGERRLLSPPTIVLTGVLSSWQILATNCFFTRSISINRLLVASALA